MFHYVRGVPFEFNAGAYDNLNMWEQIDDGAQYTPAKKFLLSVPILLFLLSTHYTHYDLAYFIINFLAVLAVVIPKLPFVSCWSGVRGNVKRNANTPCRRATECALVSFRVYPKNSKTEPMFATGAWGRSGLARLLKIGVVWSCGRVALLRSEGVWQNRKSTTVSLHDHSPPGRRRRDGTTVFLRQCFDRNACSTSGLTRNSA